MNGHPVYANVGLLIRKMMFDNGLVNDYYFRLLSEKLDPENAADAKKMRATPAGKFVLRMYEDFRFAKL